MLYAVTLTVGGWYCVGEYGRGFCKEFVNFFVAGAEVGEQQLFDFGAAGNSGGLGRGAVLFLYGYAFKVVGKGAFQTEQVHAVHEVGQLVEGASVAAIGVTAWRTAAVWHLFYNIAKGLHRVTQCKGGNIAPLVFINVQRTCGTLVCR